MYFTNTKLARSTRGAALLAALMLSTTAFAANAGEATLTDNERAAQSAIAHSPTYGRHVPADSAEASLAYSERAAQQAITGSTDDFANLDRAGRVSGTIEEATLTHNELSAQRAIVDAPTSARFPIASRASAALDSSASNRSAATR